MKKLVAILALCGFFGVSGLVANAFSSVNSVDFANVKSSETQKLSQNDIEFLFGTNNAENLQYPPFI